MISLFTNLQQATAQNVERLLPLVSPQRRDEALRYKHVLGQFTCLQSYHMLHTMLVEMGAIRPNQYPQFQRNTHGKPSLEGLPHIHFNISHCKEAIAVIVDSNPVGIDVESFRTPSESLLQYTMCPSERDTIRQAEHPDQAFALYWTKKEALFKLIGTGITHQIPDLLQHIPSHIELTSTLHPHFALTIAQQRADSSQSNGSLEVEIIK